MKFLNTQTISEHMTAIRSAEIGSLSESVIQKIFLDESGFVLVNWKNQTIQEGLFESRAEAKAKLDEMADKSDYLIVAKTIAEQTKQPEGTEGVA